MIINRYVSLNPLEPAPLSMRAAKELPLTVNFLFRTTIADTPVNYDIGATLVLTGRSDGKELSFPATSTDVSNGKASAVIPAGALKDCNGYRVQLFGFPQWGTAEPGGSSATAPGDTVIAIGVMRLIEG